MEAEVEFRDIILLVALTYPVTSCLLPFERTLRPFWLVSRLSFFATVPSSVPEASHPHMEFRYLWLISLTSRPVAIS